MTEQEWDDLSDEGRRKYVEKEIAAHTELLLNIKNTQGEEYVQAIQAVLSIQNFIMASLQMIESSDNRAVLKRMAETLIESASRTIGNFMCVIAANAKVSAYYMAASPDKQKEMDSSTSSAIQELVEKFYETIHNNFYKDLKMFLQRSQGSKIHIMSAGIPSEYPKDDENEEEKKE